MATNPVQSAQINVAVAQRQMYQFWMATNHLISEEQRALLLGFMLSPDELLSASHFRQEEQHALCCNSAHVVQRALQKTHDIQVIHMCQAMLLAALTNTTRRK